MTIILVNLLGELFADAAAFEANAHWESAFFAHFLTARFLTAFAGAFDATDLAVFFVLDSDFTGIFLSFH